MTGNFSRGGRRDGFICVLRNLGVAAEFALADYGWTSVAGGDEYAAVLCVLG
jgi:hypothetical protein